MRARIISSLLLITVLIGGATYLRIKGAKKVVVADIVPVENPATTTPTVPAPTDVADLSAGSSDTTTTDENLNTTDLVARQMMGDYLDLAATGQATDNDIVSLAQKYVDNIPSVSQSRKITELDVTSVVDSPQSFKDYAIAFEEINQNYQKQLSGLISSGVGNSDQEMFSASQQIGSAYETAAENFLKLKVPASLVETHVKLVNAYFASAESMLAISQADSDPAVAFAGATKISGSLSDADAALLEITQTLKSHEI